MPLHQVRGGGAEWRVSGDDARQRRAGQQQLPGGVPVAVITGQRQLGQPRVLAGRDVKRRHQAEHRVREPPG